MNSVTDTSSKFLPALSPPSERAFEDFSTYVYELFKAALKDNKKISQELLNDPAFGNYIVKNLPNGSKNTPRIIVLNILAHKALGKLQKQEIARLINAAGKSDYVASCSSENIQTLYEGLFFYPNSKTFSQTDLLEFEHATIGPLQPFIFRKILDHPSFAGSSIITMNDLARRRLGYLPKPHIQHLVYTIDKGDSDTESKVNALKSSVFLYPESKDFSKRDLKVLVENVSEELRPYILTWALEHRAFLSASLNELKYLTEKLEETTCSRDISLKFLSSLLKHPSSPILAINVIK
jgi:hypothetical protein